MPSKLEFLLLHKETTNFWHMFLRMMGLIRLCLKLYWSFLSNYKDKKKLKLFWRQKQFHLEDQNEWFFCSILGVNKNFLGDLWDLIDLIGSLQVIITSFFFFFSLFELYILLSIINTNQVLILLSVQACYFFYKKEHRLDISSYID